MASSVCWSLPCLISALTQGGAGGHWFRLTVQLLRGWRGTADKRHWRVRERCSVSAALGLPPLARVCFPRLHCSGSRLRCRNCLRRALGCVHSPGLSGSGSGSPQRRRLGWACVCALPRSQAQVICCLAGAGAGAPSWGGGLLPPLSQPLGFLGVQWVRLLRCSVCLLWRADLWLRPSQRMSTGQNPKKSWLAEKSAYSWGSDASLGLWLWLPWPACLRLPSPACLRWGMVLSAAGQLCSVLCAVSGPGSVLG